MILLLVNIMANWATWLFPRAVQRIGNALVNPVMRLLLARHAPQAEYTATTFRHSSGPTANCPPPRNGRRLPQRLQGLPAEGLRVGGKSGRVVARRTGDMAKQSQITLASLHPGLVGHRRMGRRADGGVDETRRPNPRPRPSSSIPSAKASGAGSIMTATRSRTSVIRRRCWPTR